MNILIFQDNVQNIQRIYVLLSCELKVSDIIDILLLTHYLRRQAYKERNRRRPVLCYTIRFGSCVFTWWICVSLGMVHRHVSFGHGLNRFMFFSKLLTWLALQLLFHGRPCWWRNRSSLCLKVSHCICSGKLLVYVKFCQFSRAIQKHEYNVAIENYYFGILHEIFLWDYEMLPMPFQ